VQVILQRIVDLWGDIKRGEFAPTAAGGEADFLKQAAVA
jgi:hypothetical protein